MIEVVRGNLLDADADALVNPVNCYGVMGRGLALQFRTAYPAYFRAYRAACDAGTLRPGTVLTFDREEDKPRYLVSFATKNHWKNPSRLEYIEAGLVALTSEIERLSIASVAVAPLGCGLGGLDFADVRPRIEAAFAPLPAVRVLLYEPEAVP